MGSEFSRQEKHGQLAVVEREDPAEKRGADELMNRLEYALRHRPQALQLARRRYLRLCRYLYRAIDSTGRSQ